MTGYVVFMDKWVSWFIRLVHCFNGFTGFVFAWGLWFQRFHGFICLVVSCFHGFDLWLQKDTRSDRLEHPNRFLAPIQSRTSKILKICYIHFTYQHFWSRIFFYLTSPAGEHCLYITHNPTFTYLYLIIMTWLCICVVVSSYSWFKFYFIFFWSIVCMIIW